MPFLIIFVRAKIFMYILFYIICTICFGDYKIKDIQFTYEYNLNNKILDDTIRNLKINRLKYSKFIELKNNIDYRVAFYLDVTYPNLRLPK